MTDCLIVGGGIIGMMCARTLSIKGAKVTLIDKNNCGKGSSSWAGAGIISPLYPWKYSDTINELSFRSQALYPKIYQQLLENTGIDAEYINSGLLMLDGFDTKEAKNWIKQNKVSYKYQNNGALFNIAQIRNSKILLALKKDLKKRGVNIIENIKINQLNIKNNKVLGADNFIADNTIICAGSWSYDFIKYNIHPIKGQIITIFDDSKSIKNIILKDGKYIVPRQDGITLIGSTLENVGFDNSLDQNVKNNLFSFAVSIFPHLKQCNITNHWCGFRPAGNTSPIIKKDDKYENLFINTGHFRNGLNTAPASSEIIANKVLV